MTALLNYLARHLVHDDNARAAFPRRASPSGPAADATVGLSFADEGVSEDAPESS